jgi:DNA-binding MarR family transcriptional regulator
LCHKVKRASGARSPRVHRGPCVAGPATLTLLDISKSALSKHISVLAEAGYVAQRRAVRDTRQRVWLRLTETGRSAYRGHVAALHRIVGDA